LNILCDFLPRDAQHYSAKRGIAIACRLSFCLWRWWIRTT